MIVTPDDQTAWKSLPYKHQALCKGCGEVKMAAGLRRTSMRCITCFAGRRHRRIGQLRSATKAAS